MNLVHEGDAQFVPKRTIGTFSQYVIIEESVTEENAITNHPVQFGAVISDHIYELPAKVTIRGISGLRFGPVRETYRLLQQLRKSRTTMDVVTGKAVYRNMAVQKLQWIGDETTEYATAFTCELVEIIIVTVQTVTVPPRANQQNPAKQGGTQGRGKQNATETTQPGRSAFAALLGR